MPPIPELLFPFQHLHLLCPRWAARVDLQTAWQLALGRFRWGGVTCGPVKAVMLPGRLCVGTQQHGCETEGSRAARENGKTPISGGLRTNGSLQLLCAFFLDFSMPEYKL